MKKMYVILITTALLSGCYESASNSIQFKWAAVNERALEKEILSRAKISNPYPRDIGMDKDTLYSEKRKLSEQISKLKTAVREKCLSSENESKQEKGKTNIAEYGRSSASVMTPPPVVARGVARQRSTFFRTCVNSAKSDPLVIELEQRKEKLDNIVKMRREHDRKVREFSQKYARQLIEQYSKSKYELVVSGKDDTVLYNSTGLALDITDALIAEIDDKSLVLTESNSAKPGGQ